MSSDKLLEELNKLSYLELLNARDFCSDANKVLKTELEDLEKDVVRTDLSYDTRAEIQSDINNNKLKTSMNYNKAQMINEIISDIEAKAAEYQVNREAEFDDNMTLKVIDYFNHQKNLLSTKYCEVDDEIDELASTISPDSFSDQLEELYSERSYIDKQIEKYENLSNDLTNKYNAKTL